MRTHKTKQNKTTTCCSPGPASLDSNHIGPSAFCFLMYLHIWLPLGTKWHWTIFGLKLFIINLEEGLTVCVCVCERWLVTRFSFVIEAQNFWVWRLYTSGLGVGSDGVAGLWALQKAPGSQAAQCCPPPVICRTCLSRLLSHCSSVLLEEVCRC